MRFFEDDNYENEIFENVAWSDDLKGVEFYKCIFKNSSFQSSRLVECNFDCCEFIQCNLSLVEIKYTSFIDAQFTDCKMIGVNWSGVGGFFSASYDGCLLNNNIFSDMNLRKFKFSSCSLVEASFFNTKLMHSVFDECDLSKCQFYQADLSFARFVTSRNYYMNATTNNLHKTEFSLPEAVSLLANLDIVLKDTL